MSIRLAFLLEELRHVPTIDLLERIEYLAVGLPRYMRDEKEEVVFERLLALHTMACVVLAREKINP